MLQAHIPPDETLDQALPTCFRTGRLSSGWLSSLTCSASRAARCGVIEQLAELGWILFEVVQLARSGIAVDSHLLRLGTCRAKAGANTRSGWQKLLFVEGEGTGGCFVSTNGR